MLPLVWVVVDAAAGPGAMRNPAALPQLELLVPLRNGAFKPAPLVMAVQGEDEGSRLKMCSAHQQVDTDAGSCGSCGVCWSGGVCQQRCATYPHGLDNQTLEQCCAKCAPGNGINCSAWSWRVRDPGGDGDVGECVLFSWLAGTRNRTGSVVGGTVAPRPPARHPLHPPHPPPPPPAPPAPAGIVRLSPGDDCARKVAVAAAGSTFIFAPGLYRQQTIFPKDGDTFMGESADSAMVTLSGAWLVPSRAISPRATGPPGVHVVNDVPVARSRPGAGRCDALHPRCTYPNDLFVDGVPLLHVNSSAEVNRSGTWFFDNEAGKILFFFLGASIEGHTVELSAATHAFANAHSQIDLAANVSIMNMTVTMYANDAQCESVAFSICVVRFPMACRARLANAIVSPS
eukprot:SAG11_NODE_912_length_6580_cov_2.243018_7_plen_401_part_00